MQWLTTSGNPEAALDSFIRQFNRTADGSAAAALRYGLRQYYLPGQPVLELLAVVSVASQDSESLTHILITDQVERASALLEVERKNTADVLSYLAQQLKTPVFDLSAPLLLSPVLIPKPWGQEIWYTGIEQRGQSLIGDGRHVIPLPWLLSLLPQRILGDTLTGVHLLKILDPLPEPVYGDLYFELHERKQEVYVVTAVDEVAWPGGEGGIRFAFNPAVRAEYVSDTDFRNAFLAAVKRYETVRREIDRVFDDWRLAEGFDSNEPVPAETLKRWQQQLPEDVVHTEQALRVAMNRFTGFQPLHIGDVLKVPCLTPHALQHGVRAIEFQTPVYERKILSFAQKVLTQAHWDTAQAVELMTLQPPPAAKFPVLEQSSDVRRESVVQFDDFSVERITLAPGAGWAVPATAQYGLLMVVSGRVVVAGVDLTAEQAVLMPACRTFASIRNGGERPVVLLLSLPTPKTTL